VATHAETIQYATQAVTACENTLNLLNGVSSEFDNVESLLRAAFDDTPQAESIGRHYEHAHTSIGGAGHAVQQLKLELSATLAHFPG
jgi:hypothetical protein